MDFFLFFPIIFKHAPRTYKLQIITSLDDDFISTGIVLCKQLWLASYRPLVSHLIESAWHSPLMVSILSSEKTEMHFCDLFRFMFMWVSSGLFLG